MSKINNSNNHQHHKWWNNNNNKQHTDPIQSIRYKNNKNNTNNNWSHAGSMNVYNYYLPTDLYMNKMIVLLLLPIEIEIIIINDLFIYSSSDSSLISLTLLPTRLHLYYSTVLLVHVLLRCVSSRSRYSIHDIIIINHDYDLLLQPVMNDMLQY